MDSTDAAHNLTHINRTTDSQVIPARDDRLSISVPIQIKRRSGRKLVTHPNVGTAARPWDAEPTPLQLALARGHRWLAMLESSVVQLLPDLARREGWTGSYVSRMVKLATLAPD